MELVAPAMMNNAHLFVRDGFRGVYLSVTSCRDVRQCDAEKNPREGLRLLKNWDPAQLTGSIQLFFLRQSACGW